MSLITRIILRSILESKDGGGRTTQEQIIGKLYCTTSSVYNKGRKEDRKEGRTRERKGEGRERK